MREIITNKVRVDVLPEYRNSGMGTYLVTKLTCELLKRDMVPFYSASVTNIGSQMVALRCGYIPAWVDTYGTVLDGGRRMAICCIYNASDK